MASEKKATRGPLEPAAVFVRIRPFASSGGHADGGVPDAKILAGWTEQDVTLEQEYLFSTGQDRYDFPRRVLGPEAGQEEVFGTTAAGFVGPFTRGEDSVFLLAYGQTGTGKTHTMFGTEASLQSPEPHGDWGIFPRVCHAALASGGRYLLLGSAVEFYLFACADLLSGSAACFVDDEGMPSGNRSVVLSSMQDFLQFVAEVRRNRTSRGTRMNEATAGHEGSSRSHCALMLTLLRLDGDQLTRTHFTLVDLAGAERPSKTGEARVDMATAFMQACKAAQKGDPIPTGVQCSFINMELFMMRHAVCTAAERHQKGAPYAVDRMNTPLIKFVQGGLTGRARLGLIVTLSPAGSNGWETWFSLQYGTDLAKLRTPLRRRPPQDAAAARRAAEAAAKKSQEDLERTPTAGPAAKYYPGRSCAARSSAQFLEHLALLLSG